MRLIIMTGLLLTLMTNPAVAGDRKADNRKSYPPTATEMIVDGLVMRPLSLAGTIVGTGVFLVTLPFSALGGNVEQAGETLVAEPARATFTNCLGCIPGRHERTQKMQPE